MIAEASKTVIGDEQIEKGVTFALCLGGTLLLTYSLFGREAKRRGGRVEKVFVELQRKSFHMVGGGALCASYHWGMKYGYLSSAFRVDHRTMSEKPLDAGLAFLALSVVAWMVDAVRLQVPCVRDWYLNTFKDLVRKKEYNKATGIAYFIPGVLAAMLAAPPNEAILGILFLCVGDAAASIGTAAGAIPIGSSPRMVEGSIGCFCVCAAISFWMGLSARVSIYTSALVSFGEVLAEIIGLDDNLVIPMLGVLGIRFGQNPQFGGMAMTMGVGFSVSVALGALVGITTPNTSKKSS